METDEILDTSVAISEREGIITVFTVVEHPPSSGKDFEILFPEMQDYAEAVEIARKLRSNGTPVGAVDILIAAMALTRSAVLKSKDNDFKKIQEVVPELKLG